MIQIVITLLPSMVGMRPTAKHAILLVTPMVRCFIKQCPYVPIIILALLVTILARTLSYGNVMQVASAGVMLLKVMIQFVVLILLMMMHML
jgi:hypothetical protein